MAENNSTQHGARFIDLTGKTFGKWYVIGYHSTVRGGCIRWLCRCQCRKEKPVRGGDLRNGRSRACHSCGTKRHGMKDTPEYRAWKAMRHRCRGRRHPHYHRYGGRGIRVCERWMTFENFFADVGPRPSSKHTLERIDNDGNYESGNVRWATRKEQAHNRCTNRLLTHNGKTMNATAWADSLGVPPWLILHRLQSGWPIGQALTEPVAKAQTLAFRGITRTIAQWADALNMSRDVLYHRIGGGWSVERALTTPVKSRKRKV